MKYLPLDVKQQSINQSIKSPLVSERHSSGDTSRHALRYEIANAFFMQRFVLGRFTMEGFLIRLLFSPVNLVRRSRGPTPEGISILPTVIVQLS